MKNTRKAILAALAAAAVLLSACSSDTPASSPPTTPDAPSGGEFAGTPEGTLDAWGFENADDVGTSRLEHAKGILTGVDIQLDATAFDSQKFVSRTAGGDIPDVVQMERRLVTTYAAQGLLSPLNDCFAAQNVDPAKSYYKNVIDDVLYDGNIYAVPQFFQPPAIIINNRVAKAAGVVPEDIDTSDPDRLLAAIGKMYKEKDDKPVTIGFDPQAHSNTEMWVLSQGGKLVDDKGAPTLDDPSNVPAFEYIKKLYDAQGGYAKLKSFSDTFDFFGDKNQYVANQVGAEMNMQWYPNVLSPYLDEIDLWTVPLKSKAGEPFAVTGGQSFVIPANAENKVAACAWAVNLTTLDAWLAAGQARSDTRAQDGAPNTGIMTGSPEADQAIKDKWVKPVGNEGFDQTVSAYYDVVGFGTSFGSSPAGETIKAELSNALISYLSGDKDATKALADAQSAANSAYSDIVS
ncbi:MAG: extracellular solute-binding protein [Propionibacteriaceae bacterium]|jgi:multiple sugar transport system substrate-binding protein|nr:extracellular solute-binding protein [Propionibacteriaceae bacterium]